MTELHLSVVIPAYNEARRISASVRKLVAFLSRRPLRYEILVVDDGSSDQTRHLVAEMARSVPPLRCLALDRHRGKGAAVRSGMLAARGRYALFTDADLATPIEEVDRLLEPIQRGFDVAIGSRLLPGNVQRRRPIRRRLASWAWRKLLDILGPRRLGAVRDTQCGFKLFRREVAEVLFRESVAEGFAFDVEILDLALQRYRVAEVPVSWRHGPDSRVSVLRDGAQMILEILRYRRRRRQLRAQGGAGYPLGLQA